MTFYLNELSLHNQFQSLDQFSGSIRLLWGCKELLQRYHYRLNCSRSPLGNRPILNGLNLRTALWDLQSRDLQRFILRWVDKDGPFWDDDQNRVHNSDEYFCDGEDEVVTDTALAEAAYLISEGQNSSVISLDPSNYLITPIIVRWHRSDEIVDIPVGNYWGTAELENFVASILPPIQSWEQLRDRIMELDNLVFLPGFEKGLKGQPFNSTIATNVVKLLSILNEFKSCFNDDGERSARGHEIYNLYFVGDKAKFSDESDQNKEKFRKEMTFPDPNGNPIFCPYHGKISHNYYRIHFNWPVTKDGNLFIAYIGPKITKA